MATYKLLFEKYFPKTIIRGTRIKALESIWQGLNSDASPQIRLAWRFAKNTLMGAY